MGRLPPITTQDWERPKPLLELLRPALLIDGIRLGKNRQSCVRHDCQKITDTPLQRQIQRQEQPSHLEIGGIEDELTRRQRAALGAAYHAGFYEWPRETTAESVSDSLSIAPATFSQHLRKAEKKVFDELFTKQL